MKTILIITIILFSLSLNAQVTKISLQASGLTCSMCNNSINKALKKIDFVDKIDANVNTSTFDITFRPGSKVDFDKLKNRVEDAGFSVANFIVTMQFNNVQVKNNEPVIVGDKTFEFVNTKEQILKGARQIKLIDKGFVSAKEYKKSSFAASPSKGVYHATIS